jgi:hypothetical protein
LSRARTHLARGIDYLASEYPPSALRGSRRIRNIALGQLLSGLSGTQRSRTSSTLSVPGTSAALARDVPQLCSRGLLASVHASR